jgi:hypothetical protein
VFVNILLIGNKFTFVSLQFILKVDIKHILDVKVFNFMEYRHEPIELIEAEYTCIVTFDASNNYM